MGIFTFLKLYKWYQIAQNITESQYGYFSSIWIFYSRGISNKIKVVRERALRITYTDKFDRYVNKIFKKFSHGRSHLLFSDWTDTN